MVHTERQDVKSKQLGDTERGICRHSHTEQLHMERERRLKFLLKIKILSKFFSVKSCSVTVLDVVNKVQN